MKNILNRLRYPKLLLLLISILTGFLIYFDQNNFHFHKVIHQAGILGVFLSGVFLAHGFTMAPATASLLIISKTQPVWPTALIATVGAILGNWLSYYALRISYYQELSELSKLSFFIELQKIVLQKTPRIFRNYFLPVFAGIISATPLPDEFSILLIKNSDKISVPIFTFITAVFSIFGVTIILIFGKYFL